MKKFIFLSLLFVLTGCALFHNETDDTKIWKGEKNTDCADFRTVKVFQTLEDSALASVCDGYDTKYCNGMTVIIAKKWNQQLWDEKVVTPPKGKCFVYDGTVSYKTKAGDSKTVPVLDYRYDRSPTSEDEANARLEEYVFDFSQQCLYEYENDDNTLSDNDEKYCECATEVMSSFYTTISNILKSTIDSEKEENISESFVKPDTTQETKLRSFDECDKYLNKKKK
jgi:hypothetical protein